jgi:FMN phosphatase YigB (HAD superfamily)
MKNNKIKLVILDAYGVTLTGGYPPTCQFLAKKFKMDWRHIYAIIYIKYFNQAAERKITQQVAWELAIKELNLPISVKEVKKIHYRLMGLNKKVIDYVQKTADPSTKILLLSKNTRSQFADVNKKVGFRKHFKYVMNTWELNLPKASEKTIRYLAKKFRVKFSEIIYIDDQAENLTAARKLGAKTILYKNFNQFKKDFSKVINN